MICLNWNYRGLGNPRAVRTLRELIRSRKPDAIFLIETLVHVNKIEEIRIQIGFVGAFTVDRKGRGGGIAFLWKAPNTYSLLDYSNNHINVQVCDDEKGHWRLTGFYGYPDRSRRRDSWNLLHAIYASSRLSWCCIGDFNDMLSLEDKRGRLDHPNWLLAGFRETISDCHLHEISIIGSCFTWERDRGTKVWWLGLFSDTKLRNLVAPVSDHNPILLETVSVSCVHRLLRFRFENGWLREPGLNKTVEDAWSLSRMGDVSSRLDQDIAQCKAVIERLRDNNIPSNIETVKEKKIELLKLLGQEEDYWRQRSKSFCFRDGDANTKYFHTATSMRKRTNRTSRLMDDEGNWHDYPSSLCQVVQDYFRKLFSLSSISDSDNEKLLSPFSFEEFKEVVFQMHPDKSPDIFQAVVFWLSREEFPASLNDTTIVLIPKCESPKTMKDLRPISLCNVLYKIVSKVLANRLKVLPNIISNAQFAFVFANVTFFPLIYLFCVEGLSALMYKVERECLISGCRICRGVPIFFFFKAEERECNAMKNILKVYEEASRQTTNFQKSGVFFSSNVPQDVKARVTSVLGVVNPINTGRYLGLPSLIGRKNKERLQDWKSKLLSCAGKEILIKSMAQAVPSYCMSTFMIHVSFSKELERMMNSFWWGNSNSNGGGIKWLRWEKLCARKEEGGMGFRDMQAFNLAMLTKQGWNILSNPYVLVCRVFKAKYFPRHSRIVLEKGYRWRIGNGQHIRVWDDPWLKEMGNFKVDSPRVEGLEDIVVSDLWIPGHKEWDVEMIHEIFGPRDASAILNIPLSYASQEDRLIWHFSPNGVYSVKSGYRVARDLNTTISQAVISSGWDKLWKLPIPPKVKSFVWRVCRECLPHISCHLCNTNVENLSHVLLSCPYAQACWSKASININVSNHASFADCLLEFLVETDYDKSGRAGASGLNVTPSCGEIILSYLIMLLLRVCSFSMIGSKLKYRSGWAWLLILTTKVIVIGVLSLLVPSSVMLMLSLSRAVTSLGLG
uniref:Reverse transcriptase zinc-binding domain-containing protein n=1 Tax=Nelumbo nucifera TaxID=4432 RepID=A0A822YM01_NELNU|nr:TPA_asm: hypothetical protein HUJ06_009219 [Nelumbo nucifera]